MAINAKIDDIKARCAPDATKLVMMSFYEESLNDREEIFIRDLKQVKALIEEYDLDPKELSRYRDQVRNAIYDSAAQLKKHEWQAAFAKRHDM